MGKIYRTSSYITSNPNYEYLIYIYDNGFSLILKQIANVIWLYGVNIKPKSELYYIFRSQKELKAKYQYISIR